MALSLEELLIKYCSPTLAGLKTGSLVSCLYSTREEIIREIRLLNQALKPKGLCAMPLRYMNGRALIYLFRPDQLKRDLSNMDAVSILLASGYQNTKPVECLSELIRRLNGGGEFPHEIGLFLGYPPEDVRGFIENRARNFKCVGCWKVYGDAGAAKKRFAQYKKCTDIYCRCWKNGRSITQLAVPALRPL
ncbi:hypothetical protein OBV_44000 [Oscillibacter valericigenes Sjm18-20]|nr:hypothetical protein OBV_44000 [Oscillibacter valericigenes Sjm18-20]